MIGFRIRRTPFSYNMVPSTQIMGVSSCENVFLLTNYLSLKTKFAEEFRTCKECRLWNSGLVVLMPNGAPGGLMGHAPHGPPVGFPPSFLATCSDGSIGLLDPWGPMGSERISMIMARMPKHEKIRHQKKSEAHPKSPMQRTLTTGPSRALEGE